MNCLMKYLKRSPGIPRISSQIALCSGIGLFPQLSSSSLSLESIKHKIFSTDSLFNLFQTLLRTEITSPDLREFLGFRERQVQTSGKILKLINHSWNLGSKIFTFCHNARSAFPLYLLLANFLHDMFVGFIRETMKIFSREVLIKL